MTVATTVRKSPTYTTNGATTEFAYPFVIASEGELKVYRTEVATGVESLLSLVVDYTVTGVGNASGGNVVISPALASGYEIVIVGQEDYTQDTDFSNQGPFHPETHEAAFDKLTKLAIDLKEQIESSIRVGAADDSVTLLPQPNGVASVLKRATNGDFSLVPIDQTIIDALGDAPIDGKQYSRKDGDWYETELGIGSVSVKEYGALGDGATDDSVAIQAAIDDCISTGKTLLFPSGTYMLTSAALTAYVDYTWAPGRTLKMVGIGEVTLKTTAVFPTMLTLTGGWDAPLIRGINFVNESPYSNTIIKVALSFQGGSNNLVRDTIVEDCFFDGFGRTISAVGVERFLLQRCRFLATKGRDGGSGDSTLYPSVGVWFFNNANGNARDVRVLNNHFSGYTGENGILTDSPTSQKVQDGFVFGTIDGGLIANNLIDTFGFEGIFVAAWPSSGGTATGRPLSIQGNVIVGDYPDASINASTWGIRCGMDNSVIQGNVIADIKTGIYVATNDTTATTSNVVVLDNYVSHRLGDKGLGNSIVLVGFATADRVIDSRIINNVCVHDFTGATAGVQQVSNLEVAKSIRTSIIGNTCYNTGWVDDVVNTLRGIRVYATEDPVVEGNRVFGAQHLISRQGTGTMQTDVFLKGNSWVITDTVDDPSIPRNDSSLVIVGDDTAYPIHATTAGAQTQNGDCGSVLFAIGAQTIVVTNALCLATSVVLATVAFDDATATSVIAVPAAGSFTLKLNATATAQTKVQWKLLV